jgi:hypothetical protein
LSQVDLFNRASARVRGDLVQSPDENTLTARECRRFYPEVMGDMLEGDHDWSFQNQRVALAAIANDRENEWLYAYRVPTNMAGAIRILPNFEGLGLGLPVALPGQPYMEAWAISSGYLETPYIIEGSTLYSNVENAMLEFSIDDIAGISVPKRVHTAFALDLGSRIAVPVKGDKTREKELQAAAQIAWERAIADDRNRHPQSSGQYVSETILARQGYLPETP